MEQQATEDADRSDDLPKSLSARLWNELRHHPFAYVVAFAFMAAGAVATPLLFPDASPWLGAIGGLIFGVYAALCAVPDKFLGS
jgi:hypothetical protein